ncbi:MAG: hypothetical protein GX971_09910 [Firmicutes bacterium]|jgi:hypothetical protein|nr:hypothetical protein [Bacillota bacterium]
MDSEKIWDKIITILKEAPIEVETVPSNKKVPLWFNADIEDGVLYVYNSIYHRPSTRMSQKRKISKSDFDTVYAYYHRWANGERHLRQVVSRLSMNTAYIFGLISRFEK